MIDDTESAIKATRMHRIPACSGGGCQQGREPCKTPSACELPIDEDMATPAFAIVRALLISLAIAFTAAFLASVVMAVWPVLAAALSR